MRRTSTKPVSCRKSRRRAGAACGVLIALVLARFAAPRGTAAAAALAAALAAGRSRFCPSSLSSADAGGGGSGSGCRCGWVAALSPPRGTSFRSSTSSLTASYSAAADTAARSAAATAASAAAHAIASTVANASRPAAAALIALCFLIVNSIDCIVSSICRLSTFSWVATRTVCDAVRGGERNAATRRGDGVRPEFSIVRSLRSFQKKEN